MFMDFLKSLSIFGEKAPPERMKELIGIIEGQADLDAQFSVSSSFTVSRHGIWLHIYINDVIHTVDSNLYLNIWELYWRLYVISLKSVQIFQRICMSVSLLLHHVLSY